MKKKHFLTRLILCLLMALLFTPAASITAQAASKKTPTKVTISSVKAMGYNRVTVKWKKAKNATSYVIYYKQSSAKKWLKLKTVSSKATSYVHKASKKYPLKQGVKYSYRVRAYSKTIKKYGAYSKAKTVKIPKKAAAKPTETTKPTVKPTEAPEPTAAPKPTVTPKPTATPIPKPTEAPKPTAAPQPTKAPQPTATPRPTATPAPTATPKPVKVSSITLNQTSLTMTLKGQTASLTATVTPDNAANKNITWSSSDSSIATVNANGTITAVANGTADITARANDGSGVSGKCNIKVDIVNEEVLTLNGGASSSVSIGKTFFPNITDFKAITFEYNDNNIIRSYKTTYNSRSAAVSFRALRAGNIYIIAKQNGTILKRFLIVVTSDWDEYLSYESWRHSIENQIWTNSMNATAKMGAAREYIMNHFKYQMPSPSAVYAYSGSTVDCYGASEIMGDFAKDAGVPVRYHNQLSGNTHDYLVDATSEGGHVYTVVYLNGQWQKCDASPLT